MTARSEREILSALNAWAASLNDRCQGAIHDVTTRLEQWAMAEHAYIDRTGALTASITSEITEVSKELVRGTLSAGTTAAVFLELAHQGKWAFLWPVIERHKDEIAGIIAQHLSGTSGGEHA